MRTETINKGCLLRGEQTALAYFAARRDMNWKIEGRKSQLEAPWTVAGEQ